MERSTNQKLPELYRKIQQKLRKLLFMQAETGSHLSFLLYVPFLIIRKPPFRSDRIRSVAPKRRNGNARKSISVASSILFWLSKIAF